MADHPDILDAAFDLSGTEIRSALQLRDHPDTQDGNNARSQLSSLLRQVARQGDIDAILGLERILLTQELRFLAESPMKTSSLDNAINELDVAVAMLVRVRDPAAYREVDKDFRLSKNRTGGLPHDEARQFFKSHLSRLGNLDKGRLSESERKLLAARISNVNAAQKLYIKLQEQALGSDTDK